VGMWGSVCRSNRLGSSRPMATAKLYAKPDLMGVSRLIFFCGHY